MRGWRSLGVIPPSPPPFHLLTVLGLEALQEMWNTTAASAVTVKETP